MPFFVGFAILSLMFAGLVVALIAPLGRQPSAATLDALSQKRDVAGLTAYLEPLPAGVRNPFAVLKTGGAYDVGKFGWHAADLAGADGVTQYVVISTPLTSEDVGEILLRRNGEKLVFIPESDALGTRVTHHVFDVRFDVPKKHADLVDTASFTFAPDAPADVIFRMSPQYVVKKITDEQGNPVKFSEAQGVVSMLRPNASAAKLKIEYSAQVNLPLYAGSISEAEATLVNDYWYPMIARMPATYEIVMHSPKDWLNVGQGERLSDFQSATERVTRYKMDLPVVYFSVISAPFKTFSQKLGGRTYSVWSARLTEEQMRVQTELYQNVIEFYASKFGPPPYPAFGAVDSKTYGGGALEAYSFATYGGGLPSLDAHEPAHTWWGGRINNTYLHSFWNESFADFCDNFYHRETNIGDHDERRLAFVGDASAEPDYATASMEDSGADAGPVGSSLGYGKGAKVLQMLEQEFGTAPVVRAMRTWMDTHPKGEPGEWPQFEKVFLDQNPTDAAKGFFADWFRRPGYADFEATPTYRDSNLVVRLKWLSKPFHMPLTVMAVMPNGERKFQTFALDGVQNELKMKLPVKPVLVSVDPWRQNLRMIDRNERPTEISALIGRMKKVVDPAHKDWLASVGGQASAAEGKIDPAGKFLVGSPESWPLMAPLCEQVGFVVKGSKLTYRGTEIDLNHGCALAVVDLPGGKQCIIGLGKIRFEPEFGRSRLLVTNDLGHFLRGLTDPKTTGKLTYRL